MIPEPPLDAPDEEWLVWSDAMQQAGDPRGHLIALAGHPELLAKHVAKYSNQLFGPAIGRQYRKGVVDVTWRRARPDVVELKLEEKVNGPQVLSELISSPIATSMRALSIAAVPPGQRQLDITSVIEWFRGVELPRTWTSLAFVDARARAVDHMLTRDFAPEPNLVIFGPLGTLWPTLQHLEELTLVVADPAQVEFGRIDLPELRAFTLHCLYWTDGTGQRLAEARWPNLRSLDLRLVEDFTINDPSDQKAYRSVYNHGSGTDDPFHSSARDYVARVDDLEPLFTSLEEVPLERLAVTSFNDANLVLELLEHHPFLALTHLDLSDSALAVGDLERLANNPLLLQLRELVLERITAPTAKALRAFPVRHSCNPRAPSYRYVVGWE